MQMGLDPELFIQSNKGRLAVAPHMVKNLDIGTKIRADGYSPTQAWLITDGFALEVNSDSSSCRDYLVPSVGKLFQYFYNTNKKVKLSAVPVQQLTAASTAGNPPEGVNEFGCLPDIDAYSLMEKTPFTNRYHNNTRYTGTHLHVSLPRINSIRDERLDRDTHELLAALWALWLDVYLGVPSVAVLGDANDYGETLRRAYYGQAGSHRVTSYGAEYRVLSGAFMLSPVMLTWALGEMRHATRRLYWGANYSVYSNNRNAQLITDDEENRWPTETKIRNRHDWLVKNHDMDKVREIIDTHNVSEARAYVKDHLHSALYVPKFYDFMLKADDKGIPLNTNFEESWDLFGGKARGTAHSIRDHGYIGVHGFVNGHFSRNDRRKRIMPGIGELKKASW
jgi:hypothetical protein